MMFPDFPVTMSHVQTFVTPVYQRCHKTPLLLGWFVTQVQSSSSVSVEEQLKFVARESVEMMEGIVNSQLLELLVDFIH
jgi:hypothetical protein